MHSVSIIQVSFFNKVLCKSHYIIYYKYWYILLCNSQYILFCMFHRNLLYM